MRKNPAYCLELFGQASKIDLVHKNLPPNQLAIWVSQKRLGIPIRQAVDMDLGVEEQTHITYKSPSSYFSCFSC
jgi:hypothetical protein